MLASREVDPASGVGARVGDREIVAGEREQALARVEEVTRTGAVRLAERARTARRADRIALFAGIDEAVAAHALRGGRAGRCERGRGHGRRCRRRIDRGTGLRVRGRGRRPKFLATLQRVVHALDELRHVHLALRVLERERRHWGLAGRARCSRPGSGRRSSPCRCRRSHRRRSAHTLSTPRRARTPRVHPPSKLSSSLRSPFSRQVPSRVGDCGRAGGAFGSLCTPTMDSFVHAESVFHAFRS